MRVHRLQSQEDAKAFAVAIASVVDELYRELEDERDFTDHFAMKVVIAAVPAIVTALVS